jgi:hypothetical protein
MMRSFSIALALLLGIVSSAAAQDVAPNAAAPVQSSQRPSQGPLVLEPVHNPFVVTPEYKVTEIDGKAGQLAGGYAGRLIDERLLIGGAVYTLVHGSNGVELTYGGVVVGWATRPAARVRFGARALVGAGSATLSVGDVVVPFGGRAFDARRSTPRNIAAIVDNSQVVRVFGRDDFFVFEPQVNAVTHFNDHVGVDLALGYRLTGFDEFSRDRLDGVTGALGVQFGW